MTALDHNTGIEVRDLHGFDEFQNRVSRERSIHKQLSSMQGIARVFAESPEKVLQELVEAASDLCGADSAGVSLEAHDANGNPVFNWAALSGEYAPFLHAMLPRAWMPCGICLDRMRPQHVRVPQTHFAAMGVEATPITDGILIPWRVDETRGTVWVVAHGREAAFDPVDYEVLQSLATFAMMAVRHQNQQKIIVRQAGVTAASMMAHELAHKINNPLQSITNSIYLADQETSNAHVKRASEDLRELAQIVSRLLAVSSTIQSGRSN